MCGALKLKLVSTEMNDEVPPRLSESCCYGGYRWAVSLSKSRKVKKPQHLGFIYLLCCSGLFGFPEGVNTLAGFTCVLSPPPRFTELPPVLAVSISA